MTKFTVVGLGYVGTAMTALLSAKYEVNVLDIDEDKINNLRAGILPIDDQLASDAINHNLDRVFATIDVEAAFQNTQTVIICTPTNFNEITGTFNTSSLETSIENAIRFGKTPNIFIKSTIPIGFTERMRLQHSYDRIFFSPEFLREGSAYQDNLTPSRIVVGDVGEFGEKFANTLADLASNAPPIILMESSEAEAVKLMANTYLAMRVAFFNEIDTFALENKLSTKRIIEGICSDVRIGNFYNNPSLGYGGYCLPKDTRQLRSEFDRIPQNLMNAIVDANETRFRYLANKIFEMVEGNPVGIYRMQMKNGSDNIRESAASKIISYLQDLGAYIIIYEPLLVTDTYLNCEVQNDFEKFVEGSHVIVANRNDKRLELCSKIVFTRDVSHEN